MPVFIVQKLMGFTNSSRGALPKTKEAAAMF